MKLQTHFILLLLVLFIPIHAPAQHTDHGHSNSNVLDAGEVNMEHSLYHMDAVWTNHRQENFQLADFTGKPTIIVMYYGNCTQVCPILIRDANRLFTALDETLRKNVRVLAVTFDPENDTSERLHVYAEEKGLNLPEWNFVTGQSTDIRELAMLLGVEYTKKSDGHFAHSNLVTLLDGMGKIIHRMEGLNQPVKQAATLIREYLINNGDDTYSHKNH